MTNLYEAPSTAAVPPPPVGKTNDALSGLIPYKNPPALIGYYFGIFSLIPFLGLICALVALPLGIVGLNKRNANPQVKGMAHAIVAISLGSVFTIVWGGLILLIFLRA